jgi:uroporphyrinogen decarboxylase
MSNLLSQPITPDYEAFIKCIMRAGTPKRVHNIELFLDGEIKDAVCARFYIDHDFNPSHPYAGLQREIAIQRFLGYDYVRCGLEGLDWPFNRAITQDTASIQREGGRGYMDEHVGPVTNWEEFESYPWPDPHKATARALEWYEHNLPDDMCVIGSGGFAHFAEHLTWLMGYETLCYALFDHRDLVQAICDRMINIYTEVLERIMNDLIDDVKIDAKHSFEDTIESVIDDKHQYGDRLTLLGGIDVDFL